ncbi:MAG: YjbQ family protein [Gammaproteobacteria bacterium]|nr:YjbQ family protein [Gammaproteobacteria bacterium]
MTVCSHTLRIAMRGDTDLENITATVQDAVRASGLAVGIATVFVQHTTASVLIIEDEPGIRADTKTLWRQLVPPDPAWQHNTRNPGEDNGHSHLRAQLQGASITIPFNGGALALGTWQQLVLLDFDTRARERTVIVQLVGE